MQVERDFSGDSADVLAFLVNNTATELGIFVAEAQRKADEERARLEQLVAERTAALEQLATTDVLTGALNRRRFLELAEQELARAARYRHSLCLAMLDLDHFKSINDRFGHAAGDEALRAVAEVVRNGLRTVDLFGRYGGEELMVALPETGRAAASIALERIRAQISLDPPDAARGDGARLGWARRDPRRRVARSRAQARRRRPVRSQAQRPQPPHRRLTVSSCGARPKRERGRVRGRVAPAPDR